MTKYRYGSNDGNRNLWVGNLFELLVGADSEHGLSVGRDGDTRVAAWLEHALADTLPADRVPLVDGAVEATRHDLVVVGAPHDRAHLAVVPLQVGDVLKRCRRVDLDDVAVDGGEQVTSIAEGTL